MGKILKKDFFERPAEVVARDLLGKNLCIKCGGEVKRLKITETEAYVGEEDEASHARHGRTERTEVMYGSAGTFYVYLIYGMHHLLNIVTEKEGNPSAVLIRGLEDLPGPGILTRELGIDKSFNKKPALKRTGLWFEDCGKKPGKEEVDITPRIGVDYAGEKWRNAPLRFKIKD